MNNSSYNGLTPDLIFSIYEENYYTIIGLYLPLFLVAFCANIVVVIVVFKDQYMRSVTNYFLVNLSVADLLVTTVCMPNAAWLAYTTVYPFGKYSCKISPYLQCISVASSIFTITAMAVDRYLAITRPFGMIYRSFSKTTTVTIIIALWSASLVLFSPILWIYRLHEDHFPTQHGITVVAVCLEEWREFPISQRNLGIVWFVFMFALPGVIMLFAYSMMGRTLCSGKPPFDNDSTSTQQRNKLIKGRKRVACILLLLAFAFAVCWLPFHLLSLLSDLGRPASQTNKTLKKYLRLLGHANSALNPIIYCALSRKFRTSIKGLFCFEMSFRRRRQLVKWADSSGSATQLHYMQRIKNVPPVHHNQANFTRSSRRQSSQKTTKTFAV